MFMGIPSKIFLEETFVNYIIIFIYYHRNLMSPSFSVSYVSEDGTEIVEKVSMTFIILINLLCLKV